VNVRGKRRPGTRRLQRAIEEKDGQTVITDATRIAETLPTLRLLSERGAKIILASHLAVLKASATPRCRFGRSRANLLTSRPAVAFVDDCIGEKLKKNGGIMQPGDILLLRNLRFYPEEENNERALRKAARVAEVYVMMLLGGASRHASTEGSLECWRPGAPCARACSWNVS